MMMAGTDDTDGSLLKSRIGTEDGPCRNYGQVQIKHRMVPAETTDRCRKTQIRHKDSEVWRGAHNLLEIEDQV